MDIRNIIDKCIAVKILSTPSFSFRNKLFNSNIIFTHMHRICFCTSKAKCMKRKVSSLKTKLFSNPVYAKQRTLYLFFLITKCSFLFILYYFVLLKTRILIILKSRHMIKFPCSWFWSRFWKKKYLILLPFLTQLI